LASGVEQSVSAYIPRRFTKPAVVERQRVSILSVPPVDTSMAADSEFFTAMPTPCCLGLSFDRTFQKKV
jgi:hypothetical protein